MDFDRSQAIVYLFLSLLYSLLGIPANCISLAFFVRVDKSDNISRYIFILLNSTDLFVSTCFIYLGVSYAALLTSGHFLDSAAYCSVMLAVVPTAQQFSVLVTAVLCVVRTVSVVRPILKVPKKTTSGILFLCFVLIIVRVVRLFRDENYVVSYRREVLRCGWIDVQTGTLADFSMISIAIISLILTPSIVGCAVTIFWLQRPSRDFPMSRTKRHATVTVIILTILCLLSSATLVVERIMRMCGAAVSPWLENIALLFAYSFTCVANPAVYFTRLSRLRNFVWELVFLRAHEHSTASGNSSCGVKQAVMCSARDGVMCSAGDGGSLVGSGDGASAVRLSVRTVGDASVSEV